MDELFRQRFENFEPEPPDSAWENVKHALDNFYGGAGFRTFLFSTFSFLILGVAIVFLSRPFDKSSSFASENKKSDFSRQIAYKPDLANTANDNSKQLTLIENNIINPEKQEIVNIPASTVKDQQNQISQSSAENNRKEDVTISRLSAISEPLTTTNSKNIGSVHEISGAQVKSTWYDPVNRNGLWKLGLSANPELTLYPNDTISNSRNYNFDFSVSYHVNQFFVQSGLGIAMARDEGRYKVDYESYDVIGTYNDLQNITFDSTDQGVIPIYETKKVEVYDSIRHIKISKTTNTYTYLQIPLLIGYQKDFKRFGMYVKAGPNLSLLINRNIPGAQLPEDIRIIDMDARIANRVNTSWQLMMGAGINYHLSSKWEIAVEPTFRYYLKSAYDSRHVSTKHPFAFGLRAGVFIKLK